MKIKILAHADAKKKRLKNFKFHPFIGRFLSNMTAVKGLNLSVEGSHVPYISSICNCLGIVHARGSQRHMKLVFGVRVCTRVKQ